MTSDPPGFTGVAATYKALGDARVRFPKDAGAAMRALADDVLARSKVYVPVDHGDLKATGHTEYTPSRFGGEARTVYGGDQAPYAVFVHEDREATHAPPTCAGFLSKAVLEARSQMPAGVLRALSGRVTVTGPAVSTSSATEG